MGSLTHRSLVLSCRDGIGYFRNSRVNLDRRVRNASTGGVNAAVTDGDVVQQLHSTLSVLEDIPDFSKKNRSHYTRTVEYRYKGVEVPRDVPVVGVEQVEELQEGEIRQTPHDILMAFVSSVFGKSRMPMPVLLSMGCIPFGLTLPQVFSLEHVWSCLALGWNQITNNYVFVVGFWGWFLAQFFKIFTKWYKTGIFSLGAFFDSGGMPSSHSSLCSAVTTAVAIHHGMASSLFAVCTCFTVIVMYDAMGVRRHAGLQAQVLNAVVTDLLDGHPVSERKLKEVLGHTPRQVLCGGVLGVLVGLFFPYSF